MSNVEKILYDCMNWEEIEAIVYSEHDNPHAVLGSQYVDGNQIVNVFLPYARDVSIKANGRTYGAFLEDEAGFFSALMEDGDVSWYTVAVTDKVGNTWEYKDPYCIDMRVIPDGILERFNSGKCYQIYEYLGSHRMEINGIEGTLFAVWAPFALRVSVVGDFNNWDGRVHPMRRREQSGVFELFLPDIDEGTIYKYEIKSKGGFPYLKSDPYANEAELRPNNASIVTDLDKYVWHDKKWMDARKEADHDRQPMMIYEVHLGSFRKPSERDGSFYNYRELAVMIGEYVKEMGYTHVELMPILEHPFDGSWGYQVTGYYAATKRYGTPEDFMFFVDHMHGQGIGVILDWVPAHFPRDTFGLSAFDGTCLYEHFDPRKGAHPHWGTLIFNYGRPEVANFLISNTLFWLDKYHVDGIRMDAVASMLYLDYGKKHGEWVANKDGGNENYEVVEFLRNLSEAFRSRGAGAMLVAEESTAWPNVTATAKNGGLGFHYKWNMGWMHDFTYYMKLDPIHRKNNHGALTFGMVYAYSEKFQLVFSHDEVVHGKGSMLMKMPGKEADKFANLRLCYGFMIAHPGKKLLFMGQDFGQRREWSEARSLDWDLLSEEPHKNLHKYMKDLLKFYKKYPALYELDFSKRGFKWISSLDADNSMVTFIRRTKKNSETLFVVCNFTPVVHPLMKVAVPYMGAYKEVFNSDRFEYGGDGNINARVKRAFKHNIDGQKQCIQIAVPPLGMAAFTIKTDEGG